MKKKSKKKVVQSHSRLRQALIGLGPTRPIRNSFNSLLIIIWELMKTQTRLDKIEKKLKRIEK